MKTLITVFLTVLLSVTALAQSRTSLTKAEVEALASGKKWTFSNLPKGKTQFDLRSGGDAHGINDANPIDHGGSDNGTWAVNDQAQLCLKWTVWWQNRCYAVLKNGDKLKLVYGWDLNGVSADLTVE